MSDYIPEEVVVQILEKLPPKSLVRFRCVSKSWDSIITSSRFISMQTQQAFLSEPSSLPQSFLIRHYSKTRKREVYSVHSDNDGLTVDNGTRIEYPFHHLPRYYFRVVGSCNGLLCLSDDLFGYANTVMLWNPSVRKRIILPMPRVKFNLIAPYMIVLGFGYDCKNLDFKIVRIVYVQGPYGYVVPPIVEVYSLNAKMWKVKRGDDVPQICIAEYFYTQAFVNGKVHWIAYKKSQEIHSTPVNSVMVFDMSDEVFSELSLPNLLANESPINMCSMAYREESLAVLQYDTRVASKSCSIWVMKKYGVVESWSKLFNVVVDGGLGMILGFKMNGNVLLAAANGELLSYDPEDQKTTNLGLFGTKNSFSVCAYRESLALLTDGKDALEMRESLSDSDSDSSEDGDDNVNDDGVEKHEFWMQCIMFQFLIALLGR